MFLKEMKIETKTNKIQRNHYYIAHYEVADMVRRLRACTAAMQGIQFQFPGPMQGS